MKTSVYGFLIGLNFIVAVTLLSINTHASAKNTHTGVKNTCDEVELSGP